MSDKVGNLTGEAEEVIGKIDAWLEKMKELPVMARDIEKLQHCDADALTRIILVAVMSYKKFVQ